MSELIIKMEFHEFKHNGFLVPHVELFCYVSDLEKFLALCEGEDWSKHYGGKEGFDYKMKQVKQSRAKRPNFELSFNYTQITVYPKENLIVNHSIGLHYICQHLFDFLPESLHHLFYPVVKDEDFTIGKLYVDNGKNRGKEFEVKALDITEGFMLNREWIDKYDDIFSVWIASRRQKERRE